MQGIKVNIIHVTSLSDKEIEDITSLSNIAYLAAGSPGANLLTGGKLELFPDLFRSMTRSCLVDGECYIAREPTAQKIVGTALWFPPGKCLWATEEIRRSTGFNTFFGQLDQATQHWWMNEYDTQITQFLEQEYGPETSTDSWWLNNIAVLPAYQRNGIATSMYDKVVQKAGVEEAIGCCTDTETNVKFYNSLKMRGVGIVNMRHPTDGSDIKVWGFKRYGANTHV